MSVKHHVDNCQSGAVLVIEPHSRGHLPSLSCRTPGGLDVDDPE